MAKKPFMEMDIDEFEDKNEEVIDEPNLDFDFDDDAEETTSDTETQTENKGEISEGYKAYLADVEAYKNNPQEILDKLKELVSPKTLPEDFINGVGVFSKNDYPNTTISKDGEIIYCVDGMYSVPQIIRYYKDEDGVLDKDLLPLSNDGYGNEIVLRMSDGTYHVHYHDRFKDGKNIMIQIASSFDELIKALDSENNESTEEASSDETTTDDTSETPEIPEEPDLDEPEVTQEAMFDAGFGNLRSKIAQALDGRFKVTNVGKGMNGKDSFTISGHIDEIGDVRTTVTNTGTGCEVISRGDEGFKRNFANISLSAAFEKIKELFDHPQLLFAEAFNMGKLPVSRFYQEADESTLKWINRDASKIAKMWKESQFPENHTKSVSDLINEYRKYYETNFRIKKPVLDKAFDVISKRLTDLFNKGYICGGYVDGYKLVLFHKDWLDKDIVNRFRSRIDSNPAYLIYIDTETIPHAQLGVSVTETSCDYDGKTDFGNTRKLMKQINNNTVQESYVQEANEEEVSDDDEETMEIPEMPDLDEDEAVEEAPEADTTDGIEGFGMDTSDVQNEFDPKDIEALNKLIAAESEAINDYFDASKDTRDEDLRTLFSDIGHEERFHLEQLMYAKSKITGEKYEPRDPEVKAEYEELMNGGMDEETAAYTAMDKRSMLGEDDGDDSDMEELEQESAFITDALYRNEIITSQLTSNIINNPHDISKELGIIVEAFYQEAIDNVSSAPKQYTKIDSPLTLLTKGLKVAVNGLTRMSAIIRDSMRKDKLTRARKREWIKKHGIMELFKSGIHLYLFDDNKNKMDLDTPCRYVDFLYRLTKAIGESCGVKLTAAAQHKTISNPIKFKDVNEGMYKLSQVIFNKTKVVVTDENKAALQNEFFGYSDEKVNVKVTHGTDQVVNDSGNIYNRLDACILVTKKYAEISIAVLDEIKKLEGDVNSVYYKNRAAYNKAMKNIKLVVDKYTQFISAMSHDLTELMKLDNGLLKMTRERDMTEQGGGKWEGPDIRVSKQTSSGTQYTKRKK
jgi:rubrerythrin